jgi:saccharopine dehydrogenase-like NADP-dependent oxidoreductase
MSEVLILGGTGRIGRSVAQDLLTHTTAGIVIAGRHPQQGEKIATRLSSRVRFREVDLSDATALANAIRSAKVVVHCAGPFHYRDGRVLELCIRHGVNYLDVSDHRSFTVKALEYRQTATEAGITAIVNTGIFPGISNSMVRQDVEALETAEQIHLSYVVAGSGGAGKTVMRTTFLGLQHPFSIWQDGGWQVAQPYSEPEAIEFPAPYGKANVYWFDMPEAFTLPQAFPVQSVVTKFGSVPNFYNYLTWALAHKFPKSWLQHPAVLEFMAWGSYTTTRMTDPFSGVGVGIRSYVTGTRAGQPWSACSTLALPDTAVAAGYGTGSIAQLLLNGALQQPGVWTVEEALSTSQFQQVMAQRGVKIPQLVEARRVDAKV